MGRHEELESIRHPNEPELRLRYKTEHPLQEAFDELWVWYVPRVLRSTAQKFREHDSDVNKALEEAARNLCLPESRNKYDSDQPWIEWAKGIVAHISLHHPNEPELRQRYKSEGPPHKAFDELWGWYEPRVFRRTSLKILERASDVDDALEESALKLCLPKTRGRYDSGRPWLGWATTIVVNTSIDTLRKRNAIRARENHGREDQEDDPNGVTPQSDSKGGLVDTDNLADDETSSADWAVHNELSKAVRDCIAKDANLDPYEKVIVVGIYYGRMTRKELRQRFEVSPATIHNWEQNAINKLKRCLARKGHREKQS